MKDASAHQACAAGEADVAAAAVALDVVREWEVVEANSALPEERPLQNDATHCWRCSKNVGLTGIRCRCGYIFCSEHRYAECHDCDFDHKQFHRQHLEKQILGCVAEKLEKL